MKATKKKKRKSVKLKTTTAWTCLFSFGILFSLVCANEILTINKRRMQHRILNGINAESRVSRALFSTTTHQRGCTASGFTSHTYILRWIYNMASAPKHVAFGAAKAMAAPKNKRMRRMTIKWWWLLWALLRCEFIDTTKSFHVNKMKSFSEISLKRNVDLFLGNSDRLIHRKSLQRTSSDAKLSDSPIILLTIADR